MKKVLISNIMMLKERDRFDREIRALGYEPVWADVSQFMDEEQCLSIVGEIDGWLAGDDRITRQVFEKATPSLKVVAKWGTGVDSIDHDAARDHSVPVLNSPGAFANTVAEVALHYMLSLARNLVEIDRDIRNNAWPKPQGIELGASKVGVIGFGAIGRRIGMLASCTGAEVCFFDPFIKQPVDLFKQTAQTVTLDEMTGSCDFIILACSYNKDNHHLVNEAFLAKMKSSAALVNVARGSLVDEPALVYALENGIIAGAGLDVFEVEPLPQNSKLRPMKNVVLGSHNANNSLTAVENVHTNTLKNLQSVLG
jgi:D-3-phosphoglycerate dehydrogenase